MDNLNEMFYELERRLNWFIEGINIHNISSKLFNVMTTEAICEFYNVHMSYFKLDYDKYCKEKGILNSLKMNINNHKNYYQIHEITKVEAIKEFGTIYQVPLNYKIINNE